MCSLGEHMSHMSVLFSLDFSLDLGSKYELCNFVALVMKSGFTGVEKEIANEVI
jgi:hypothetical protein